MNKIGVLEILMSMIQPSDSWKETERWNKFGSRMASHLHIGTKLFSGGSSVSDVWLLWWRCYQIQVMDLAS